MKVNNKSFIRKIAKNILKENKIRRNILMIAIILTSILFTTIFAVVFGILKSMEFETMKSVGTISHGSFKNLRDEDIKIISKNSDIKNYSIRTKVGIIDDNKIMAEISNQDDLGFKWDLIENVEGRPPKNFKEIFADKNTLKKLGYKGEIGEKIKLNYEILEPNRFEVLEKKSDEFIVSGIFENSIDSNVGVGQFYVSKDYADSLNLPSNSKDMQVMLKNSFRIREKLTKIANNCGYNVVNDMSDDNKKELKIGVNFAYFSNDDNFDYKIFLPILFFVFIVFLSGYLIINNIFEISINEDIKFYGLLKTIGMTREQTKELVKLQGVILLVPSVVIGNLAGFLLGKIILKKVFENNFMLASINFDLKIYLLVIIFSILFSVITVLISSNRPAKKAEKISPIEASRSAENVKIKNIKSKNISINKLVRRQIFSNKFRFVSIILSMALSSIILNSVISYTSNINIKKGLSDVIITDYNVATPRYFRYMYYDSEGKLDKKYIEEIKNEEGYIGGGLIYSAGSEINYPKIKIEKKKLSPIVFGIDDYLIEKENFVEGEFDKEKWNSGNYALIGELENKKSKCKVGDEIKLNYSGNEIILKVMGKMNYNFANGLRYFSIIGEDGTSEITEKNKKLEELYVYISPENYKNFMKNNNIMSFGFDVKESDKKKFNSLLSSLENNPDFSYDSRDRQIKSFENMKNLVEFVGLSISSILFLISILNFINIISTEILKNKINLSILESIGMTSRDIEKYLIKKSFIYSISSFVFSIILMILIDSFILRYLFNSFNWAEYKFTIMPLVIVNIANILIGVLFTIYFYKKNTKESLVDRIRNL